MRWRRSRPPQRPPARGRGGAVGGGREGGHGGLGGARVGGPGARTGGGAGAGRGGGSAARAPPARQVTLRTDARVLELAAGLKREKPARTAAQVARILRATCHWSPSVRTLQRHFERLELVTRPARRPPATLGRVEPHPPSEL